MASVAGLDPKDERVVRRFGCPACHAGAGEVCRFDVARKDGRVTHPERRAAWRAWRDLKFPDWRSGSRGR